MKVTQDGLNKIIAFLKEKDLYVSKVLSAQDDEWGTQPTLLDRVYVDGEITFDLLNELHTLVMKCAE